ncbi:MAG TPA: NAD-dependent epimerase/dehydratase family protein [Hyphomicrobiaceae bacterium]|nr:NAD-dependent epimerase/dehydratase family protein [Hyphomicrobiaceae bacterium]
MRAARGSPLVASPALRRTRYLLVTGGAGFIGCNLADRLAREGEHVLVLDSLGRAGVERNLSWLKRRHPSRVAELVADVREAAAAEAVAGAAGVFHLAAQVAVTTSIADPAEDLDVNVRGTLNLLDAARRRSHPPPFIFASTNKVYGNLADIDLEPDVDSVQPVDPQIRRFGIGEHRPLAFHTPYGCSKGAADQYVLDYARTYGVPSAVLRMSCTYGPHQHGSEDQGWIAHFIERARRGEPITIYGDGRQVRDVLYVEDAVEAYVRLLRQIGCGNRAGHVFNLGGGPGNVVSLRQMLREIEELLGHRIELTYAEWRPGDQRYYVSDTRRITNALALAPPRPWRQGLRLLAEWANQSAGPASPEPALLGVQTPAESTP